MLLSGQLYKIFATYNMHYQYLTNYDNKYVQSLTEVYATGIQGISRKFNQKAYPL